MSLLQKKFRSILWAIKDKDSIAAVTKVEIEENDDIVDELEEGVEGNEIDKEESSEETETSEE